MIATRSPGSICVSMYLWMALRTSYMLLNERPRSSTTSAIVRATLSGVVPVVLSVRDATDSDLGSAAALRPLGIAAARAAASARG